MEINRIFFVSPVPYWGLKQRHQGLAEAFARRGVSVEFVDPVTSPGWHYQIGQVHENLRVHQATVPFRAARFPGLQRITTRMFWQLATRNSHIVPAETVLWIADPGLSALAKKHWLAVCYDRCDRHGFFPGQHRKMWQKHESILFSRSRTVFASSPLLASEARQRQCRQVVDLPNAAGMDWLEAPPHRRQSPPPLKILSSGAHYEWVDCAWLESLLQIPNSELHLAGVGRGTAYQQLRQAPRVVDHGLLSPENLIVLCDTCHIGVVPFKDLPLTRAVDPVKIYEYAARGLEIWVPDIPGLREHPLVSRVVSPRWGVSHKTTTGPMVLRGKNETKHHVPVVGCVSPESGNASSDLSSWPVKEPAVRRVAIPTWDDRAGTILEVLA